MSTHTVWDRSHSADKWSQQVIGLFLIITQACFVREKVFWDLLQNFTEQLICCISDSISCSVSLTQGQTFANPKCCMINNVLLQQTAGLQSWTNPSSLQNLVCLLQSFIFCIGFCFKEIGFPVSILFQRNQKRKSDLLLIQDRSHFKYHPERNVLQLILWFMTTPFRTITIYTFIYRVSWCHIFGKVTGQRSVSQFSLHQKTFSRTAF